MAPASRVPPPPDAPQEVHDRYVEETRRERAELEAEERQRRVDAAVRAGMDVTAAEEHVRELEDLARLAAALDEASWPRVRAAAQAILARKAS
jgi:hypothetical protein